jgi:hypothetical protein
MRPTGRFVLGLAAALAALMWAAPVLAYTIYLKDGSHLVAKQKYEVRGNKAIIVLLSGTETALPLAEIDVSRTDRENVENLGTAIVLDDSETRKSLPGSQPPPSAHAQLGALIRSGAAGVGDGLAAKPEATAEPRPRPSGFDEGSDAKPRHAPLRDRGLAAALDSYISKAGLPVEIAEGSRTRRPLLVYETDGEGPVFRALVASAGALLDARKKLGSSVEGVEVLCQTSEGSPAAHFDLDPQDAADLISGRVEITSYFVDHVLF